MNTHEAYHLVLYRGKPHGFKGHIKFQYKKEVSNNFIDIEHLYVKENGNYIPYFVEEISIPNNTYCIIKLEDIKDDQSKIQDLYILEADVTEYIIEEESIDYLIGYSCEDKSKGLLGVIERVDQLPGQDIAIINYHGKELLVPLVADFIIEITDNNKNILFDLPEGFIEIFEK